MALIAFNKWIAPSNRSRGILLKLISLFSNTGMLAPMLVQMERQIDREIAADNKANGIGCATQTENDATQTDKGVGTESVATETDMFDDTDSENDDDDTDGPMLMYGPQPQIVTNDLKSLDEMVCKTLHFTLYQRILVFEKSHKQFEI